MVLTKYVACICEGAAEKAIMEILLDADKLIFKRDDLLEGELLRCRSGKNFEEQHLRKGFTERITVLRILDSRREQFRLSKAYEHKIEVINVITAPEIEMLVIFKEGKYEDYKKSGTVCIIPHRFVKISIFQFICLHPLKICPHPTHHFSYRQLWSFIFGSFTYLSFGCTIDINYLRLCSRICRPFQGLHSTRM